MAYQLGVKKDKIHLKRCILNEKMESMTIWRDLWFPKPQQQDDCKSILDELEKQCHNRNQIYRENYFKEKENCNILFEKLYHLCDSNEKMKNM